MADQSAQSYIESLVRKRADFPYDGRIVEIQQETVTVKLVGSDQVIRNVRIPDHIPQANLSKGLAVRLDVTGGQRILLAILPQFESDPAYSGKGSLVPYPPQPSVYATQAGWLVSWAAVPGADRYRVYRNDTADETTPDEVGYTTARSITIAYESPYVYFAVKAVSGLSESEVSGWVTDDQGPPVPVTFAAYSDTDGHVLTIDGDEPAAQDPSFRCFEIERALNSGGSGATSLGYFFMNQFPSYQTFAPGVVRAYRIRSVDWAGNVSAWTNWAVAIAGAYQVQDKFDTYISNVASSGLDGLWWGDGETDIISTYGTVITSSDYYVDGTGSIKVTANNPSSLGGFSREVPWYPWYEEPGLQFGADDYFVLYLYVVPSATFQTNIRIQFEPSDAFPYYAYYYDLFFDYNQGGSTYLKIRRDQFILDDSEFTPSSDDQGWHDLYKVTVAVSRSGGASGSPVVYVDDMRFIKADPDDAATYSDTGYSWDKSANTGSDYGEWHIYPGNRSGEPSKAFSYGQIKTAASPSVWYLSYKPTGTVNILAGTIQAGIYVKGSDGAAGLAFFVHDVTPGSWDMYVIEADSAANQIRLVKWVAGTRTVISTATFAFNPNQQIWVGADFAEYDSFAGRIRVFASLNEGNIIQASNLLISTTDTSVGSGGTVGVLSYQANVRFVSFTAGSPVHAEVADVAKSLDGPILANNIPAWQTNAAGSLTGNGTRDIFPQASVNGLNARFEQLFGDDVPANVYQFTRRTFVVNSVGSDIIGFEDDQASPYSPPAGNFTITTPSNTFSPSSKHFLQLRNDTSANPVYLQWTNSTAKNLLSGVMAVSPLVVGTDTLVAEWRFWAVQSPGANDRWWAIRWVYYGSTKTQFPLQVSAWYSAAAGDGLTFTATTGTKFGEGPFYPGLVHAVSVNIVATTTAFFNVYTAEGFGSFATSGVVASMPSSVKTARFMTFQQYNSQYLDQMVIT